MGTACYVSVDVISLYWIWMSVYFSLALAFRLLCIFIILFLMLTRLWSALPKRSYSHFLCLIYPHLLNHVTLELTAKRAPVIIIESGFWWVLFYSFGLLLKNYTMKLYPKPELERQTYTAELWTPGRHGSRFIYLLTLKPGRVVN